jgi:hypothetical protein
MEEVVLHIGVLGPWEVLVDVGNLNAQGIRLRMSLFREEKFANDLTVEVRRFDDGETEACGKPWIWTCT